MPGVRDRVALVTGAGSPSGIGFATAKLLLAAGAKVAITSTTERIHQRLEELGAAENLSRERVFAAPADLTDPDQVSDLIVGIESALGEIDILVNNAGMTQIGGDEPTGPLRETSNAGWRYGLDISLNSAFLVTRAVLPAMRARGYGRVVQISSVTGPVVAIPGSGVYAVAKAGMLGLTRALAIEEGDKGITVNAIGPGWIHTGSSSEAEVMAGRHTPIGRSGAPEEVGHAAVFLASEEASYITGQMLVVDGGNTIQEYKVAVGDG